MPKLIQSKFFLPYNPALKEKARTLRNNMTPAEKHLWYDYLSRHTLRFLRQRPIDNYIVDFYCPELRLVIEVDGDTHFSDQAESDDAERTKVLESHGLKVIRFTNWEIMAQFDGVIGSIEESIAGIGSG